VLSVGPWMMTSSLWIFLSPRLTLSDGLYMMKEKAFSEIFNTNNSKVKSARIVIEASPKTIFELLANPYRHVEIDATNTIKRNLSGPDKLTLGAKFRVSMHLGISYLITNKVVEFEENKLIAWSHFAGWRWRHQLRDLGNGYTEVTETFDGSHSKWFGKLWLKFRKAYPLTQIIVAKSLVALKKVAENDSI
jgi:hypothetical protein